MLRHQSGKLIVGNKYFSINHNTFFWVFAINIAAIPPSAFSVKIRLPRKKKVYIAQKLSPSHKNSGRKSFKKEQIIRFLARYTLRVFFYSAFFIKDSSADSITCLSCRASVFLSCWFDKSLRCLRSTRNINWISDEHRWRVIADILPHGVLRQKLLHKCSQVWDISFAFQVAPWKISSSTDKKIHRKEEEKSYGRGSDMWKDVYEVTRWISLWFYPFGFGILKRFQNFIIPRRVHV